MPKSRQIVTGVIKENGYSCTHAHTHGCMVVSLERGRGNFLCSISAIIRVTSWPWLKAETQESKKI